jgi:hypothetical protein
VYKLNLLPLVQLDSFYNRPTTTGEYSWILFCLFVCFFFYFFSFSLVWFSNIQGSFFHWVGHAQDSNKKKELFIISIWSQCMILILMSFS